jgi:cytochrome c biogenesis protein CcdA
MMVLFSIGAGVPFMIIGVVVPMLKQTMDDKFIASKNVIVGANKLNRYLPIFMGVMLILIGAALIFGFDLADVAPQL